MNGSCSIDKYQTKSGMRYRVRYRLGGAGFPMIHAGSFKTRREAEARKRWIDGELAAMRVPNRRAVEHQGGSPTIPALCKAWVAGRIDVTEGTRINFRAPLERIGEGLKGVKAAEVQPAEIAAWIVDMHEAGVGRTVIDRVLAIVRGALDDYGLDPNPARSRVVRVPKVEKVEANPPPFAHWQLILDGVSARMRLPLRVLEGTGLRSGELIELRWADVDLMRKRIFVRGGKTAAARRWVPLPEAFVDDLDLLYTPRHFPWLSSPEPNDKVFPGLQGGSMRMAMRRACRNAGIPLYSPHDLRHRYITLLIRRGMDPAAVASRVGHTKKSMTLDVYSHLLLGGIVSDVVNPMIPDWLDPNRPFAVDPSPPEIKVMGWITQEERRLGFGWLISAEGYP